MISCKTTIHRSRWLLPVSRPPLENGALVCQRGRIIEVGKWQQIKNSHPEAEIFDHGEAIIFPGLVNCHTHLDNSGLKDKLSFEKGDMTRWIDAHFRARSAQVEEDKQQALEAGWKQLRDNGTIAVADITYVERSLKLAATSGIISYNFLEVVGFGLERANNALDKAQLLLGESSSLSSELRQISLAPHAPHSLHGEILAKVIRLNREAGRLSTIHLAESLEEVEFLLSGQGPFLEALQRWGFWEGSYKAPALSPVEYLKSLNLTGPDLLAVHCTHLGPGDIQILRDSCTRVCLCPRSNDFIGNGQPNISSLLAAGIDPCLGTDGLASNESLSLFDEMEFIRNHHPDIPPETLLKMATSNGAQALGLETLAGSLEKNKLSRFLIYKGYNGASPVEEVTGKIKPDMLEWAGGEFDGEAQRRDEE